MHTTASLPRITASVHTSSELTSPSHKLDILYDMCLIAMVEISAYSLFQTLIYQAAFNPNILPWGSASCDEDADAPCHVRWAGGTKSYESVALIASALVFLGQSILFIFIGSTADYGSWAPWIMRINVLIYGGLSLGFFGLQTPDAWPAAMALYTLTSRSLLDPHIQNPAPSSRTLP